MNLHFLSNEYQKSRFTYAMNKACRFWSALDFEAFLKMTLIMNINLLEWFGSHNTAFILHYNFHLKRGKNKSFGRVKIYVDYVLYNYLRDINTYNTQLFISQESKLTKKCILHCLICVLGNKIKSKKISDIFYCMSGKVFN